MLDAESDGSNDERTQVDEKAEWLNAELQNSGDSEAKSFIDSSEAKITQLEDTLTTVVDQNLNYLVKYLIIFCKLTPVLYKL